MPYPLQRLTPSLLRARQRSNPVARWIAWPRSHGEPLRVTITQHPIARADRRHRYRRNTIAESALAVGQSGCAPWRGFRGADSMREFWLSAVSGLLATVSMMGCSEMKPKSLEIRGVLYTFPREHVDGLVRPEEGNLFVRLAPPNQSFLLIYSENNYLSNEQGDNVPTIAYINDVPNRNIRILHDDSGPVICEPGLREFNCGLRVVESGIRWSVLFNQRYIKDSLTIRTAALEVLSGYNRKTP